MNLRLALSLVSLFALGSASLACSGESEDGGADGGAPASGGSEMGSGGNSESSAGGSTNEGGASAGGGGASTGGGGASTGGTEGQLECCLAAPTCAIGETQISTADECPEGASCYESSICCTSIWCVREEAQCKALPTCLAGAMEVEQCPQDVLCTTQSLCGTTIVCQELPPNNDTSPTCPDGAREDTNRDYLEVDVDECAQLDLDCDTGFVSFADACGCGCEQDASCPEFIDCMPGGNVDPLCAEPDQCPLTERAY